MRRKKNDKEKIFLAKALIELERRRFINPLKFIKPLEDANINQRAFLESKKKICLFLVVIVVGRHCLVQ